jgi:hypothetical protein
LKTNVSGCKVVDSFSFVFNPHDNGGEQLILTAVVLENDKGHRFSNQQLSLQSYCNSASMDLVGAQFTPETLRKLANKIEKLYDDAGIPQ